MEARSIVVTALDAEADRHADDRGVTDCICKQCRDGTRVRTSRVAIDAGSLIRGKSIISSICDFRAVTRSARIRFVPVRRSDAAASRYRCGASSRGRSRLHGQSGRASCKSSMPRHVAIASSTVSAARDLSAIHALGRADQLAGQELAFGPMQFQLEYQVMPPLPALIRQERLARDTIVKS